jgi:hypothetical protein
MTSKIGFKICPKWLKLKYLEAVDFKCQDCKESQNNVGTLEIHRIKRGNQQGLYTVVRLNHKDNNIKILCNACHKKYHYKEFKTT